MLVTWLVEIWLNQLGKLNDQMESDGKNQFYQEKEIMQEEFRLFLASGSIRVRTKTYIQFLCTKFQGIAFFLIILLSEEIILLEST